MADHEVDGDTVSVPVVDRPESLFSCIECEKAAGYSQLELNVAAENVRVLSMYEKAGFVEYGRQHTETGNKETISCFLRLFWNLDKEKTP